MVSVEQTAFFQRLTESPLKPLIQELTSSQVGNYIEGNSNASYLALNLLIALKEGNRLQAERFVDLFSKRKPTKESHWIYDNYVLFCIVAAITKFGLQTNWISSVINLSLSNSAETDKCIKETFKNILAGNYSSKNDFHQISMLYQFLSGEEQFQDEYVNRVFSGLWLKSFPFYDDDFLNLVSLKAIEIAVIKKSFLNNQQQYDLNTFVPSFEYRADLLANVISWLIVFVLILAVFYGLVKLNAAEVDFPKFVKLLLFLIGVSGVGVLGIIGWKKGISKLIRKTINSFFRFKRTNSNPQSQTNR